MNKRNFLTTTAALSIAPLPAFSKKTETSLGPVLLTVTGTIGLGNRGPRAALDEMFKKHQIEFDKAYTFDLKTLSALPAITMKPTLEYDALPHILQGPLLSEVIRATGAPVGKALKITLRGVDGYITTVTLKDLDKYRYIVATHVDNHPLPVGGLGPLWAVYDADRFPEMAAKPVTERFQTCPWGLYHIHLTNE